MIGFRMQSVELHHAHVLNRVAAGEVRALRKIGFATRGRALLLIKPGAGASAPGDPPHSHLGLLTRFMRYAVDAEEKRVVIGPEFLARKSQNAPAALEKGGESITTRGRRIRVAARPFMSPALAGACRLLPTFLTDSVTEQSAV